MPSALLAVGARRDFHAAMEWIAQDSPKAATRFAQHVRRAAERIGDHPEIGVRRPDWIEGPIRILTLGRFPYVLVYDDHRRPPLILRILHGARDLPNVLNESIAP